MSGIYALPPRVLPQIPMSLKRGSALIELGIPISIDRSIMKPKMIIILGKSNFQLTIE